MYQSLEELTKNREPYTVLLYCAPVPRFDGSGFKAKYKNYDSGVDMLNCTIVGNIYDNLEVWEVKE